MKNITIIISLILINTNLSYAQIEATDTTLDIDDLYMDFAIPKVTAFSLLNVEPGNILKPGTVKEFTMGVGSFVDANGNFKSGLAVEWAPFLTKNKEIQQWQNKFQWQNLLISGATSGDSLGGKLAMAFRWSPIDYTNPLQNPFAKKEFDNIILKYRNESANDNSDKINKDFVEFYYNVVMSVGIFDTKVQNEITKFFNVSEFTVLDSLISSWNLESKSSACELNIKFQCELQRVIPTTIWDSNLDTLMLFSDKAVAVILDELRDRNDIGKAFNSEIITYKSDFKKKNWNKMALEVGGGQILFSPNSRISELAANYGTLYLSFATPLNWYKKDYNKLGTILRDHSQVIFQIRSQYYYAPDSTQNNNVLAGARFIFGTTNWHFMFEGGYIWQANFVTGLDQSYLQYAFGFDYRISDGNWIEFALGGAQTLSNTGRLELSLLPRIAFRHAFQKESRFD